MPEQDTADALRALASEAVHAELERALRRLPDLAAPARAELAVSLQRVTDRLLRPPTDRIRPGQPDQDHYADALRRLFGLTADH